MEKQGGDYSSDNSAYKNDEGGFKGPQQGYPQQQHGYPQQQQQGYPQQGFSQPGYPPQNQNYPMQQQQYPAGTNFVVTQPTATTIVSRPNDYFVFSLLTCLFCFWPTGIAALIFSCNSREANDRMDYNAAQSNGRFAKILSIVSLILGLVWIISSKEASDRMDYNAAESNGRTAKIFSIVTLLIGLVWIISVVIWAIVISVRVTTTYVHYG